MVDDNDTVLYSAKITSVCAAGGFNHRFNQPGNNFKEMKCYTSITYIFLCNAFLMVVFKSSGGGV